jgi:hypothetical protein
MIAGTARCLKPFVSIPARQALLGRKNKKRLCVKIQHKAPQSFGSLFARAAGYPIRAANYLIARYPTIWRLYRKGVSTSFSIAGLLSGDTLGSASSRNGLYGPTLADDGVFRR